MLLKHHKPLGNPNNIQDPLPKDWRELEVRSWDLPDNFWVVNPWVLYRSAIVYPKQVEKLKKKYWIWHIISLVDWTWLKDYYEDPEITIHQFPILERKALTRERIEYIIWVINNLNKPALVHCLKWATRTWMVCSLYEIQVMNRNRIATILGWIRFWNVNISAIREICKY